MRTEFEFTRNLRSKYSLSRIGDDCAVLPKDSKTDMVVTADLLVEDIDFRLEWTTAEFLGHKALAVSLSDIAAMGAKPVWAMLSVGIHENIWNSDFIDRFYEGWLDLAKQFEVELIGGDVSRTPDKIVIDSIVGGEVSKGKAILRSTAKVGDFVYVTGELGGAAGGLILLESGLRHDAKRNVAEANLLRRQLHPTPRLDLAAALNEGHLAAAMIDISDGLASDLKHICDESGVGARLFAEKIPVDPNLSAVATTSDQCLGFAINGGEDFELLFTTNKKNISKLKSPEFSFIGEITASAGIIKLEHENETRILQPKGFRHF